MIPEIIKSKGEECKVKRLKDTEFLSELEKKLHEELAEYEQSKSPEELADILEVIYRIAELRGFSREKMEKIREKKAEERGGFEGNLFLIRTYSQAN
jgi:predicted house-cleaning noncanonical NTP pyrophosphatase (MazG superfamily)